MFTGLIEEVGTIVEIPTTDRGSQLQIAAPCVGRENPDRRQHRREWLLFDGRRKSRGTTDLRPPRRDFERTNLGKLRRESRINLERALAADGRIGGHFLQGHVDCAARIVASEKNNARSAARSRAPRRIRPLCRVTKDQSPSTESASRFRKYPRKVSPFGLSRTPEQNELG